VEAEKSLSRFVQELGGVVLAQYDNGDARLRCLRQEAGFVGSKITKGYARPFSECAGV
jgi:hypothetical protein